MKEIQGRPPVVFYFQPESYKIMESPEELQEWERLIKEEVGFKGNLSNVLASCCESKSGGVKDDCDQD
jgi:hypothetical protein